MKTAHSAVPTGLPVCCATCRYWSRSGEDVGACRRHAPILDPPVEGDRRSMAQRTRFPETDADCWCGDYVPLGGGGKLLGRPPKTASGELGEGPEKP